MHNPNVKWDDIIGLESAKRTIKEAVVYPIKVFHYFLILILLIA
jgi:SpoVK/Ycf46/Vps4 family AAA+-type ATPase